MYHRLTHLRMVVSIHRLLRAWPVAGLRCFICEVQFRSTGSYEPDRKKWASVKWMKEVSIHRLLRAWPYFYQCHDSAAFVSIHRLLRAWPGETIPVWPKRSSFDPQALTSLTQTMLGLKLHIDTFRSTGSYEPDPVAWHAMHHAGIVSIHRLLRAWPSTCSGISKKGCKKFRSTGSYEPDQFSDRHLTRNIKFRSTGSYEPDLVVDLGKVTGERFDPQALTSLTVTTNFAPKSVVWFRSTGSYEPDRKEAILKALSYCFDPQALTSLTNTYKDTLYFANVSIHRLLRAWPVKLFPIQYLGKFRSTGSYEPDHNLPTYIQQMVEVSIHRLLRAWPVSLD